MHASPVYPNYSGVSCCPLLNTHQSAAFFAALLESVCSHRGPRISQRRFWAEVDPMVTRDLEIKLLTILADGCKKHPAYRALRPATGRCEPCVRMWQARLKLRELEK